MVAWRSILTILDQKHQRVWYVRTLSSIHWIQNSEPDMWGHFHQYTWSRTWASLIWRDKIITMLDQEQHGAIEQLIQAFPGWRSLHWVPGERWNNSPCGSLEQRGTQGHVQRQIKQLSSGLWGVTLYSLHDPHIHINRWNNTPQAAALRNLEDRVNRYNWWNNIHQDVGDQD